MTVRHVCFPTTVTPVPCCFSVVIGLRRIVTETQDRWIVKSFLSKAGYTWRVWDFAATVLPPNGTDQRLSHCSLPLCLRSEYAHRSAADLDRVRSRCPAPSSMAPTISLPWPWPPIMLKGTKIQNKQGPEHRSGVAFTSHCSRHQSRR